MTTPTDKSVLIVAKTWDEAVESLKQFLSPHLEKVVFMIEEYREWPHSAKLAFGLTPETNWYIYYLEHRKLCDGADDGHLPR